MNFEFMVQKSLIDNLYKAFHPFQPFELGNMQLAANKYQEATASFDQALKTNPSKDDDWYNRGIVLKNLGRYEEAIAAYDQAIKINPNHDSAWYERGYALKDLGRYEEAITAYDQAIKINPSKDDAWYNKACCYALLENLEQTIESLQRAIALNPEECREMAKTDLDFDSIREDEQFQKLIQGISEDN